MTERKFKNDIVRKMKAVGTHHESHEYVINLLARCLMDYHSLTKAWEEDGEEITIEQTNVRGKVNKVKNPMYLSIEKLRDDILAYSRELGLTPAGLKRINEQGVKKQKKSKLEDVLSGLGI